MGRKGDSRSENQTLASLSYFMRSISTHSLTRSPLHSFSVLISTIYFEFSLSEISFPFHNATVQQQQLCTSGKAEIFSRNHHKNLMKLAYTEKLCPFQYSNAQNYTVAQHVIFAYRYNIVVLTCLRFSLPSHLFLLSLLLHLFSFTYPLDGKLFACTQTQIKRKRQRKEIYATATAIFFFYFYNIIKRGISKNRDESFVSLIRFRIIIVLYYYLFFQERIKKTKKNGIWYARHSSRTNIFEHYNPTKHVKM